MIFSLLFLCLNLSSLFRFSVARGAASQIYNQSGFLFFIFYFIIISPLLSARFICAAVSVLKLLMLPEMDVLANFEFFIARVCVEIRWLAAEFTPSYPLEVVYCNLAWKRKMFSFSLMSYCCMSSLEKLAVGYKKYVDFLNFCILIFCQVMLIVFMGVLGGGCIQTITFRCLSKITFGGCRFSASLFLSALS